MTAASQLRDQIVLALKTVGWLNTNGYLPINQQAGNYPKPKITIESSKRCERIKLRYGAEIIGRGQSELGNWVLWQSERDGCLIEWMEVTCG